MELHGQFGHPGNRSAWGASNAPDGRQTAVLQGQPDGLGAISQTVFLTAGTYQVAFKAARREAQIQPVRFSVDGSTIGSDLTPGSDAFVELTTAAFTVTTGTHMLTLAATNGSDDRSTFIDQVRLVVIGNIPPVVSLSVATNGTTGVPLTMSADASDPDGTIAKVDFFVGSVLIGTDATAPYSAIWTNPGLGDGYSVTATATDNLGASTISPVTLVTIADTPNTLPAGWTAQDVGGVALSGSTTHQNGTWTLSGSGADIWKTADGFQFASQRIIGDVQMTAQVSGLTNTDAWAKAGVMIRESLSAGSRHASTFATAANGIAFQRRTATGGVTSHTAGPGSATPYWVRIARSGNVVISSSSPDGTTWTEIRRQTITMTAAVYIGLAVTSHNNGALCTGTFTNVQVVGVAAASN